MIALRIAEPVFAVIGILASFTAVVAGAFAAEAWDRSGGTGAHARGAR